MPVLLGALSDFKNITIVCHPNADPDCIGSAYALLTAIRSSIHDAKVTIYAPESINTASYRILDYLKMETSAEIPPYTDVFLLVDTSSLDQVPSVKSQILEKHIPYILLDHHVPDAQTVDKALLAIIREKSSTCEIVYEELNKKCLTRDALLGLLVGIIYDSRRFLINPDSSIKTAAKLMRMGAKAELALQMLSAEQDSSERIARLKASARLRLFRASSWIIALTHVGAFEASVARGLTDLGADLALVINDSGDSLRLTGRSQDLFYNKTGLNLAKDLMQRLAGEFSGQGGGHPTAASANLKVSTNRLLPRILDILAEKVGIQKGSIVEIYTKK